MVETLSKSVLFEKIKQTCTLILYAFKTICSFNSEAAESRGNQKNGN